MKIAIDASRAVNERAGIGRYTLELIKKLIEIDKDNQYLLFFSFMRSSIYKKKIIKEFQKYKNVEIKIFKIPGNLKEKVWGWKVSWFKRFLKGVDVYYAPSFLEVNLGLNLPQVVTIYDLTPFLFPEHLGKKLSDFFNLRTKQACEKAAKIIVISESTKNDLQKTLKVPESKLKVIYPGLNLLSTPSEKLPAGLKPKLYILTVGTLEPRKNLIGLFKAYVLLPPRIQRKYPLAIVGAKGWNTGETFEVYKKLKLEGKVKFLGYVSDAILANLYHHAAIFVYPSLYEGFGFPVLEALSYGIPVVTSNISSLPEVIGKAGLLVNPQDPKEITSAMQKLLEHKNERERLSRLSKAQAAKFNWQISAKQTLKIFDELKKQNAN